MFSGYYKQCVEAAKITHILTTPAMIRDMICHDAPTGISYNTSSLKLIAYGECTIQIPQYTMSYIAVDASV